MNTSITEASQGGQCSRFFCVSGSTRFILMCLGVFCARARGFSDMCMARSCHATTLGAIVRPESERHNTTVQASKGIVARTAGAGQLQGVQYHFVGEEASSKQKAEQARQPILCKSLQLDTEIAPKVIADTSFLRSHLTLGFRV